MHSQRRPFDPAAYLNHRHRKQSYTCHFYSGHGQKLIIQSMLKCLRSGEQNEPKFVVERISHAVLSMSKGSRGWRSGAEVGKADEAC